MKDASDTRTWCIHREQERYSSTVVWWPVNRRYNHTGWAAHCEFYTHTQTHPNGKHAFSISYERMKAERRINVLTQSVWPWRVDRFWCNSSGPGWARPLPPSNQNYSAALIRKQTRKILWLHLWHRVYKFGLPSSFTCYKSACLACMTPGMQPSETYRIDLSLGPVPLT